MELLKWGILSGIFLAFSIGFTSPFLILRRNALFPHALTHVLFLAIILLSIIPKGIPRIMEYPFLVGVTLVSASGMWFLRKVFGFYEDTATSIITHTALAIALIIAAKSSQYDARLLSYLFGSIIGVTRQDFYESLVIFLLTLGFYAKFKPFWITQITDEEVPGIDFKWANFFFLIIVTLQILIGIKLMGILLVSVLFVFSGSIGLKLFSGVDKVILSVAILNSIAILGGAIFSIFWDFPFSGSTIIFMLPYLLLPALRSALR
jgi:zinc transport system permease protein